MVAGKTSVAVQVDRGKWAISGVRMVFFFLLTLGKLWGWNGIPHFFRQARCVFSLDFQIGGRFSVFTNLTLLIRSVFLDLESPQRGEVTLRYLAGKSSINGGFNGQKHQ